MGCIEKREKSTAGCVIVKPLRGEKLLKTQFINGEKIKF